MSSLDLLRGTLDVLILKTLTFGPLHGYGVARRIGDRSSGELQVEDAALYQALHRMERKGWLRAEWGVSENNRRAKYYEVTISGRSQLRREERAIRRYAAALFRVLDAEEAL